MKTAVLASLLLALGLSACKPKAPEQPNKPPIPNAQELSQISDTRPHLSSHIDAGGRRTQYDAFFEGSQIVSIRETADDLIAEYHYRGGRLLKYMQTRPATDAKELELDERGRVQHAVAGARALATEEIDAIRTRAQLLRSHALAQRAIRMHGH